jgi:predicted amidophosphoribosyltransferase
MVQLQNAVVQEIKPEWKLKTIQPVTVIPAFNSSMQEAEVGGLRVPDQARPVALAYNPSYSGGRDQEDRSLKQALTNSSRDHILQNPSQK